IGVGCILAPALFGDHGPHRRITPDQIPHPRNSPHAGLERDGRRKQRPNPQVALFELRQEFGAKPQTERATDQQKSQGQRGGGNAAIVMITEKKIALSTSIAPVSIRCSLSVRLLSRWVAVSHGAWCARWR